MRKSIGAKEIVISLFLPATGLIFPFFSIFSLNRSHLQFDITSHFELLGILFAASAAVCLLIQQLITARHRKTVSLVLLYTSVVFWLEFSFLTVDIGILDGAVLDWSKHNWTIAVDAALLVGLLCLFIVKRHWIYQNITLLAAGIALMAVAPLLSSLLSPKLSENKSKGNEEFVFTTEGTFDFSPDSNVILFVLDTLQADIVAELIESNQRIRSDLDGFTFFANSLSAFPKTYASVPTILTGKVFDNSNTLSEFLVSAYFDSSLPLVLKENKYDSRLWPYAIQPLIPHPRLADNIATKGSSKAVKGKTEEFSTILDLALFRVAPVAFREWIYNEGKFRVVPSLQANQIGSTHSCDYEKIYSLNNSHTDLDFLDQMSSCASKRSQAPTFRFFHLSGAHQPLVLNRKLEVNDPAPVNRTNFLEHSFGALTVLSKALEVLKQLEIYDSSLIIVVGDHGGGELGLGVDSTRSSVVAINTSDPKSITSVVSNENLLAGATPAIMVKRPNSNKPFEISNAPVELTDIVPTVLDELGIEGDNRKSMFDYRTDEERIRLHKFYRYTGWDVDYLIPLTEFRVAGHSWDPKSWQATHRDLLANAVKSAGTNKVLLREGGNSEEFLLSGWKEPGKSGIQAADRRAGISFPISDTGLSEGEVSSHLLDLEIKPLTADSKQPTELGLESEGVVFDTLVFKPGERQRTSLVTTGGRDRDTTNVWFLMGDEVDKKLTFTGMELKPYTFPQYIAGSKILFSNNGNSDQFVIDGFSHSESWGRWTQSGRALLALKGLPTDGPLTLKLTAIGYVNDKLERQRVEILANGQPIGKWLVTNRQAHVQELTIGANLLDESGKLVLEFKLPDAISPRSLVGGDDIRPLGIGFVELTIDLE